MEVTKTSSHASSQSSVNRLTNGLLLTLVVGRQLKAIRALIAQAVLAEVDAVVDGRVDALCT